jgi:allophanate hydrolase subunit 2
MSVGVLRAGFLTTVQDLGREGFRNSGVSPGGALDPHAIRIANLLIGNEESAAGLEITFGSVQLRFTDARLIAWCGGDFDLFFGSTPIPSGHAALIDQGETLTIDRPRVGCRCWIAISGGIDVPAVLGSRSTDLRAKFGGLEGRALRDHDELPLGANSNRATMLIKTLYKEKVAPWKPPHDWSSPAKREPILRFTHGSDWDYFNNATRKGVGAIDLNRSSQDANRGRGRFGEPPLSVQNVLTTEAFNVSPDSDRMGVRFDGPELKRDDNRDLISEAVAPGTVQVPPNGKPILLLNDCQTIGGYPKIANVITVDLPIAAQLRAGDEVLFRELSLSEAHRLLIERTCHLEQFRCGLESHFA